MAEKNWETRPKRNWEIRHIDDYVAFRASDDIIEEVNKRYAAANAANREFLKTHAPAKATMPISGTFICAQPPNYKGLALHHASQEEWEKLFARFKTFGVDTVIYQAAVWNELETVFYPSRRFAGYRTFDCIGKVLAAAKNMNLTVFMGGYGSAAGWGMGHNPELVAQEKANHFATLDELFELYDGQFAGIYFAPETAYRGERDLDGEKALNSIYRDFCDRLKEKHPNYDILMSPATKYYPGKLAEMRDSWLSILDGVQLDIMAPQDSIGCCGNTLEHQPETFRVWKEICDVKNIRFWSNVELFEDLDCGNCTPAIPAEPERIAMQIQHASAVAEKLISWEMGFYTDEICGERGMALKKFLQSIATAGK